MLFNAVIVHCHRLSLLAASCLSLALLACDAPGTSPVERPDGGPDGSPVVPETTRPGTKALDRSVLHEIRITVGDEHLAQLESDREKRVPCTIEYDGVTLSQAGIRQKGGNGSISDLAGKPGFSVKLDEFVNGQKLDGLKKLILNNAIQDVSLLNEPLGYEIYRRAGIPAPRTAHAIVSLNGMTYGIYVLAEAVDGDFLKHAFGDGNHKGNLYEGTLGVDFVEQPGSLELKDEVEDQRSRDDVNALAQAVRETRDQDFIAVVSQRLDLDGFIRGYAIDALLVHWDGYSFSPNNYYLYADPGTKRFVFMPHGMDQLLQTIDTSPFEPPKGLLAARVRAIPALDRRFHEAIRKVLEQAWDVAALEAQIDEIARVLHSTTRSDERVLADLQGFDDNVELVKNALRQRKSRWLEGR